jgi:L-glutamine:2-deoxy-scyllo-inosose/3-amino-2,3-dideoxy-scyllo-inosose aminotransferase
MLAEVLGSGRWAYDGPVESEFERRFAELQTARYGLCVANGTVALQLALEALDIGVGDEVIVPGFTWQATVATVVDVNAMPVLVDADPETYCPDPSLVEAAITPRTRAIVVVHLYNSLTDMDRILEIARRHGLYVVEDCAHSHGSRWRGQGVGSIGDIGTFSFQASKTLTAGEGGFDLGSFPAVRAWLGRVAEQPGYVPITHTREEYGS